MGQGAQEGVKHLQSSWKVVAGEAVETQLGEGAARAGLWSLGTRGKQQIIAAAIRAADVLGTCFHDC